MKIRVENYLFDPRQSALIRGKFFGFPIPAITRDYGD